MHHFSNYHEWHSAITGVCRLELTRAYCEERRRALADEKDPATRSFLKSYGSDYRDLVVSWFQKAENEAES